MRLVSKAVWSVVGSGASIGGAFVQGIIVARFLGPEGTGRVGYLVWIVSMFTLVANLGLSQSATKFIAEAGATSTAADRCATVFFARWLAALSGLATAVLAGVLAFSGAVTPAENVVTSAYLLTTQLGALYLSVSLGRQEFRSIAVQSVVGFVLQLAAAVILVPLWGVTGALVALTIGLLPRCATALAMPMIRSELPLDRAAIRRIWQYSMPAWVAAVLASLAWTRTEVFFLERYCDNARVAFFTVGLTIASLGTQFPQLLINSLFPHFSALAANGGNELERITEQCLRLAGWAIIPGAVIIGAGAPVWVVMLFGQRFAPAGASSGVLALLAGLMLFSPIVSYLQSRNRSDLILVQAIVGGIIGVVGCYLLVPRFGLWGALLARTAAHIAGNLTMIRSYHRLSGAAIPGAFLVKTTAVASIASLPLAWVCYAGSANRLMAVALAVVAGLGYLAGTRIFGLLEADLTTPIIDWLRSLPRPISLPVSKAVSWVAAC
jgi:O-antigen/teichoic acid export membrane protein